MLLFDLFYIVMIVIYIIFEDVFDAKELSQAAGSTKQHRAFIHFFLSQLH